MRLPRGATLGALFLVAMVAGVAYLPGLPGEFVYDDHRLIERNEGLTRPFDPSRAFLRDYYASDVDRMGLGYYRPVAILSNELDFRRGGGMPLAFHATNILLHALCSMLVLGLGLRLFDGKLAAATAAGALFALHPAHAESVAFISGRVDPFATLFVIVAALAHLRANRSPRPVPWRAAAGGAWLAALLSKEMAVTAPLLLLALETAEEGGPRSYVEAGRRVLRYVPFVVAAVAYAALRRLALGALLAPATGQAPPSLARPFIVIGSYLAWLVLPPHALHLEPAPPAGIQSVLAAAVVPCAIALVVLLWRRQARVSSALAAWCIVTLLPVAQLRPIETELSERFLYLPSVGACLLLDRVPAWRNEVVLWQRKLAEDPTSVKALLNLARTLAKRGDLEGARTYYERARTFGPYFNTVIRAEMESFLGPGGGEASIAAIRKSLESLPTDGALWNNLGFLLLDRDDLQGATEAFHKSVELVPARSTAWIGLALTRLGLGDLAGAAGAAERAESLNPALGLARVVRAECALREGRPCDALEQVPTDPLEEPGEEAMRRSVVERATRACADGGSPSPGSQNDGSLP